jgi:hypothetical protein
MTKMKNHPIQRTILVNTGTPARMEREQKLFYLLAICLANLSCQANWMLPSLKSHFHATNTTHGILEACLLRQ